MGVTLEKMRGGVLLHENGKTKSDPWDLDEKPEKKKQRGETQIRMLSPPNNRREKNPEKIAQVRKKKKHSCRN